MKDLSHIMMFEGKKNYFDYYDEELVCLFNINNISQDQAIRCFEREEYNDNVLVMTKKQWTQLFNNGIDE